MSETATKATGSTENLPDWLQATPVVQQAQKEHEQAQLKERQRLAKELDKLQQAQAAGEPELEAALAANASDLQAAQERVRELQQENGRLRQQLGSSQHVLQQQAGRLQQQLQDTAPESIDAAIAWFQDRHERLMRADAIHEQAQESERNIATQAVHTSMVSNIATVQDALRYCRDAVQTLERLKLEPSVPADAIQELKDGLPDTETPDAMRTYEGVRQTER